MKELFALLNSAEELRASYEMGHLSHNTFHTALRLNLGEFKNALYDLRRVLEAFLKTPELADGFFETADLAGAVEYCPLCDCSRAKGHAENCLWSELEEFLR